MKGILYRQKINEWKILVIFLFLFPSSLIACTAFSIKNGSKIILAKNLDWEIDNGIIIINKKGVFKTAFGCQENKLTWISKYGSVTFNQFGKEFPLGGMNEKGLVIEELNSWGETPDTCNKNQLNEFQWIQYCLDNYANVNELLEGIKDIVIVPLFLNLHYLISDSYGNTTIIEFYNNRAYIYTGDSLAYPVLSNNHYENSLKYLKNFKGFGGNLEVKPENTSGERFVKTAYLTEKLRNKSLSEEKAFEILDHVKQPDTQWSIVYDISEKKIHFKTSKNRSVRTLELSAFDFTCNTPVLFININEDKAGSYFSFKELLPENNRELLTKVFDKYSAHNSGQMDSTIFMELAEYGNFIKCEQKN
jgi:penicillin V acylase-like amidase (Ntn superfamily)